MTAHEWVDASGMPWSLTAEDDMCAICSGTPDAHSVERPDLIDRRKLLKGLAVLGIEAPVEWFHGIRAAFAYVEDYGE